MEKLTKAEQSDMDPLTIGLAIAGAKKLLETATDLKDISGSLEHLFNSQEKKPAKVKHKKPTTRMQQLLRIKAGDKDYDDDTSISSVANDILAKKQNEVALHNLGVEIDRKWGRGTFEDIQAERAKRLEAKDVATKKSKDKAKKHEDEDEAMWDRVFNYMMEGVKVLALLLVTGIGAYVLWINRCTGGSC